MTMTEKEVETRMLLTPKSRCPPTDSIHVYIKSKDQVSANSKAISKLKAEETIQGKVQRHGSYPGSA